MHMDGGGDHKVQRRLYQTDSVEIARMNEENDRWKFVTKSEPISN